MLDLVLLNLFRRHQHPVLHHTLRRVQGHQAVEVLAAGGDGLRHRHPLRRGDRGAGGAPDDARRQDRRAPLLS